MRIFLRLSMAVFFVAWMSSAYGQVTSWNGRTGVVTSRAEDLPGAVGQSSGATDRDKLQQCIKDNWICDARGFEGSTVVISETVIVYPGHTLIANPATLYTPGSAGMVVFRVDPSAVIDGATLSCRNFSFTGPFSGAFIATKGDATYDAGALPDPSYPKAAMGRAMSFRNIASDPSCLSNHEGALVELISTGGKLLSINGEHIHANGLGYGLLFVSIPDSNGAGFINGVNIQDFLGSANKTCILMQSQRGMIWSNWIQGNCEGNAPDNVPIGIDGIRLEETDETNPTGVWANHFFVNVFDFSTSWRQASSRTKGNEFHGEMDGTSADSSGGIYSVFDSMNGKYITPSLATQPAVGNTCVVAGYVTMTVNQVTRKIAYCQ